MGSHRTRTNKLESSQNIWDVPLTQKLDLTSKNDWLIQQRLENNSSLRPKDPYVLMQKNISNVQNRKPNFRQSTALPKSYKQFVATVNSGQNLTQQNGAQQQPIFLNANLEQVNMYKTTQGSFQSNKQHSRQRLLKKNSKTKDEILKMITQIEFGENSDTFRALAKQLYVQNIQKDNNRYAIQKTGMQEFDRSRTTSGSLFNSNSLQQPLVSKNGLKVAQSNTKQQSTEHNQDQQVGDILTIQKQLWQQFQLLRILKQAKYQKELQKCQSLGDGSQPAKGPPKSQSLEYGFDMTEEQIYNKLFLNPISTDKLKEKLSKDEIASRDASKAYASFDCPECVQMACLMLDEELRYLMSKGTTKRKGGKSKDALFRQGAIQVVKNGQQHKGIAGLQTQGVSLKNQKFNEGQELDGLTALQGIQDNNIFMRHGSQGNQRIRAQTQNNAGGKRGSQHNIIEDSQLIGQIFISRAQPQVFFKNQNNQSFKQVVRGEQVTQHLKQNSFSHNCTCGANQAQSGPYQPKNPKVCVCIRRNYDDNSIPPFHYGLQQKIKTKLQNNKGLHIKGGHGQPGCNNTSANEGGHGNHGIHGSNSLPKIMLDGTTQGYKRKYKPAIGIYQPPLQPFKHLAQSSVNQTISKINELVLILFKTKIKSSDQQLIKLFKFFSIPIPRGNGCVLDLNTLKAPDFLHAVNQKLLIKLFKVLNHENADAKPETSTQIFRFYVGRGNNYVSVRQIISRRTWWNRGSQKQEKFYGQRNNDAEEFTQNQPFGSAAEDQILSNKSFSSGCHFIWTQWRKTEHHEYLQKVTNDKFRQRQNEALLKSSPRKNVNKNQEDPLQLQPPRRMQATPYANVPTLIYNRLEDNYHLSNKKALFLNVSAYYQSMGINPFEVAIPLTFNVKTPHQNDSEYIKFTRAYNLFQQQNDANIWIIKPGENSNRGTGIEVASSLNEIRQKIQQLSGSSGGRTAIVQKYLDKPLLIHNRKFDIRGYSMITSINGVVKGYMYRDCYFRTSSKQFDLTNLSSRFIHLTNDAVQMNSEDYGKFESGNKLSINDFQRYLDSSHGSKNVCFMRDLFPQMERLVTDSFRAVGSKIDPHRLQNCFEIFGYDFMIDENFKVYLIEANTNPCLEICCPLLARIIPELLDNSFRIAIDPLYQPSQFLAKLKDENTHTNALSVDNKVETTREAFSGVSNLKERAAAEKTTEGDVSSSPNRRFNSKDPSNPQVSTAPQKRQRLELLTPIKYTLIYDERIDLPIVEKLLKDYEKKQRHEYAMNSPQKTLEGGASSQPFKQTEGVPSKGEGASAQNLTDLEMIMSSNNDYKLLQEIKEEEKLDEQAAKKEEIEAAENEEAFDYQAKTGIMPQYTMLIQRKASQGGASEDDEDDELESEDEFFN